MSDHHCINGEAAAVDRDYGDISHERMSIHDLICRDLL